MQVLPAQALQGTVALPGDKSVSHRAAILLAMSDGSAVIDNFSGSADCGSTLECLGRLGVEIDRQGPSVRIKGVGKTGFRQPDLPLDCGNSGTTMRLLAGALAGQNIEAVLTGDRSLSMRPMKRIIRPLRSMGCRIDSASGSAPLKMKGCNPLSGAGMIVPEAASAQIKSAVLLAGLNAASLTSVMELAPTRDHTERMLRWLGARVLDEKMRTGRLISVSGKSTLTARDITVPSDISAATFFMVGAACLPGSDIDMKGVGLNGTRAAAIELMRSLGANIETLDSREVCNEPVADIRIRGGLLPPLGEGRNVVDGERIANLIDEIPALAVFGTQIEGGITFRDAAELRVKECDRISAIVENLARMGAGVEEFPDGFSVRRSHLSGAAVDSFGDHRIAMAFAVAALFAKGPTQIHDAECCEISFPGFFGVLDGAAVRRPNGASMDS